MNKVTGIYEIVNKINNKRYIGKSIDIYTRWYNHKNALNKNTHKNIHLQQAWNKYGEESFEFNIILLCDRSDLNEAEINEISKYRTFNPEFGYNNTYGGDGTCGLSENAIEKKRKSIMNYYAKNPEAKRKRSDHMKQFYIDYPEKRKQQQENTRKQFQNKLFYDKYIELRTSDEYRKRISEAHKGIKQTEEAIKKIKEKNGRPVMCVETGVVYQSAREASRILPGNLNIQAAASGRRKTAGGFHWEYVHAV